MKKNFLLLPFVGLLLSACVAQRSSAEKAEAERHKAQLAKEMWEARRYTIDVNYVYPQRMAVKHLSYGYHVRISGDSLYSYLPYFGRAYRVPYGGGEGLHFVAPMASYQERIGKHGEKNVEIVVERAEDTFIYMIEMYDNGRSSIHVNSREREAISYSGQMIGLEK